MLSDWKLDDIKEWLRLLRTWAVFGANLGDVRQRVDWSAAAQMTRAVAPLLDMEAERLEKLLRASRKKLAPLDDPFDVDLGLHRWLEEEREEAYSDWLAWVVQQATTPGQIFRLFGLGSPPRDLLECQHPDVQRECCVPHGHIDQEGRLDIVIRFAHQAIIVVEVKKGAGEDADIGKHEGYKQSLNQHSYSYQRCLFLATSPEEEPHGDFTFISWADVCIEMRLLAFELKNERHYLTAAMVLAFVAAVEQNLLGFSASFIHKVRQGQVVFFNAKVVDHLESFLEKLKKLEV